MVRYMHPMTGWAKTQLYKMEVKKRKTILHFSPSTILKPHVFVV